MTPEQKALIRSSWSAIADDADGFVGRFYLHLFLIDVSAARLFVGVDMRAQRKKLAQTLGVVVQSLDDLDRIVPDLIALGQRHAEYGVRERHFESVARALVAAFADTLGSAFTADVRAAWMNAYAILSSIMQGAVTQGAAQGAQPA